VEKYGGDRLQMTNTTKKIEFASLITEARIQTHTLIMFNDYCLSTTTFTRTCLKVTLYAHCLFVLSVALKHVMKSDGIN
jgi:hypothetical protein